MADLAPRFEGIRAQALLTKPPALGKLALSDAGFRQALE